MATSNPYDDLLVKAFKAIRDPNALAWSVLDTKSETTVTSALALSVNRLAAQLVARTEYERVDLALFDQVGIPVALYEAKAAYATDFQPQRITDDDWYLGGCIDDDLQKLSARRPHRPTVRHHAALFYIYVVGDPSRQLKYGRGRPAVALTAVKAAFATTVKFGTCMRVEALPCQIAHGTTVDVHLCLFEPKIVAPSPP